MAVDDKMAIQTFLNQKLNIERTGLQDKVGFLGIGINTSYDYPGVEDAPDAIRTLSGRYSNADGSAQPLNIYNPERGYILTGIVIDDLGNLEVLAGDDKSEENFKRITAAIQNILREGGFPVIVGGDHYITYPVVAAYEGPITVVQLDAHADCLPLGAGCPPHGSVMTGIYNLPNVKKIIHAGIRGNLNTGQGIDASLRAGNSVITCSRLLKEGIEPLVSMLAPHEPVHITFDCDELDPSIAPGVGVPEPDGIGYGLARDILCSIAEKADVKGIDFNEYNPKLDWNGITGIHITNLIMEFISKRFEYQRQEN